MRVIAHKFYQSSILNSVSCMDVDQAWKILMKDHERDLEKLQKLQLAENLTSIRKAKNSMCKFGSFVMCIFFYIQKYFPIIGDIVWEKNKLVIRKINKYITQLGENFENFIDTYFEEFKKRMKMGMRIPKELIMKHYNDLCFLVDTDNRLCR